VQHQADDQPEINLNVVAIKHAVCIFERWIQPALGGGQGGAYYALDDD
jgi:hypothetical protein